MHHIHVNTIYAVYFPHVNTETYSENLKCTDNVHVTDIIEKIHNCHRAGDHSPTTSPCANRHRHCDSEPRIISCDWASGFNNGIEEKVHILNTNHHSCLDPGFSIHK